MPKKEKDFLQRKLKKVNNDGKEEEGGQTEKEKGRAKAI